MDVGALTQRYGPTVSRRRWRLRSSRRCRSDSIVTNRWRQHNRVERRTTVSYPVRMMRPAVVMVLGALLTTSGSAITQRASGLPATDMAAATAAIVSAANAVLSSLDDAGRAKLQFAFDDDAQRKRWSNLPGPMFERRGLRLGDLSRATTRHGHEAAADRAERRRVPEGHRDHARRRGPEGDERGAGPRPRPRRSGRRLPIEAIKRRIAGTRGLRTRAGRGVVAEVPAGRAAA